MIRQMQRTNIIELKPNKNQKAILKELMLLSSCVYNSANYIVRQQFFKGEKISGGLIDLQQKLQKTQDYQLLGRSYALPRIQVYGETNSARFKLIKSKAQKYVGLPKYLKNRKTNTTIPSYLVMDGCQYSINKNKATIPLSRQMRKKYGIKHFDISYNGMLRFKGLQQRGQIHFKEGKFYLHQPVELKDTKKVKSNVKAGLDISIKRFLAVRLSNGEDKLIGKSKRFHHQWQYHTDLIAKEQAKLALQNRKSSRNLQKLYSKRTKYMSNLFNNLVAKMFRFLKRNNVSTLVMGDLTGIREDNDKGRKFNQMMHNYWSFDTLAKKIENKAEEFGIELQRETEEYTSTTCPMCYDTNKSNRKDRIFICSFCGYVDDSDLLGAGNILLKSMCGSTQSTHWCEIAPLVVV